MALMSLPIVVHPSYHVDQALPFDFLACIPASRVSYDTKVGPSNSIGSVHARGLVAHKSKSAARSTLTHILNNLFNTSPRNAEGRAMRVFWTAVVLVAALCAWGCAPTSYQRAPATFGHGYSDKRLSEDTFHVAFMANWSTSADTIHQHLYRRVAELTVRYGFRYFAVIRGPSPLTEYRTMYRSQEDREARIDGVDMECPAWGTMHMTIQCFKDARQAAGTHPIDATAHPPKSNGSGQG